APPSGMLVLTNTMLSNVPDTTRREFRLRRRGGKRSKRHLAAWQTPGMNSMNRVGWPRHWRWFLNAGERVRLFRTAEDRARPEQDRHLDAAVFLRRRAAGHDAGGRSSNGHGLPPAGILSAAVLRSNQAKGAHRADRGRPRGRPAPY